MFDSEKETVDLGFNQAILVRHAWQKFRARLEKVRTLGDALTLLQQTTPIGAPSHKFYINLADFFRTYDPPRQAGLDELAAYRQLVEQLVAENALSPEKGAEIVAALAQASLGTHPS